MVGSRGATDFISTAVSDTVVCTKHLLRLGLGTTMRSRHQRGERQRLRGLETHRCPPAGQLKATGSGRTPVPVSTQLGGGAAHSSSSQRRALTMSSEHGSPINAQNSGTLGRGPGPLVPPVSRSALRRRGAGVHRADVPGAPARVEHLRPGRPCVPVSLPRDPRAGEDRVPGPRPQAAPEAPRHPQLRRGVSSLARLPTSLPSPLARHHLRRWSPRQRSRRPQGRRPRCRPHDYPRLPRERRQGPLRPALPAAAPRLARVLAHPTPARLALSQSPGDPPCRLSTSPSPRSSTRRRNSAPASPSRAASTPCATPSPPTCSKLGAICPRSRICSVTATSRPPPAICISRPGVSSPPGHPWICRNPPAPEAEPSARRPPGRRRCPGPPGRIG
jgi:hypothetical protein